MKSHSIEPPYFLGIDPDLHTPAWAIVDSAGFPVSEGLCCRTPGDLKGFRAVAAQATMTFEIRVHGDPSHILAIEMAAIEGQTYRRYDKRSYPQDLIHLAASAGVLAALAYGAGAGHIIMPEPTEWKGDVPKHIHQGRICQVLGWEFDLAGGKDPYCVPRIESDHSKSHWKHLLDGYGLALHARKVAMTCRTT